MIGACVVKRHPHPYTCCGHGVIVLKIPIGSLGAIARFIEEKTGWRVIRSLETPGALPDATARDLDTIRRVRAYTMTSAERQWALINAVRYVVQARVAGDIVECGVWRGGAAMAAALTLLGEGAGDRRLWLYDTFAGMTEPAPDSDGSAAVDEWRQHRRRDGESDWCRASLEDVRANMELTGYPAEHVRYVKGSIEETLRDPMNIPDRIAVLRLDTDWYESTRIELEKLYPRLAAGGVLIIDDYGYWQGARKAVDEFFAAGVAPILLNRIDETGRIGVKPSGAGAA
jgi:O-methyltransferase